MREDLQRQIEDVQTQESAEAQQLEAEFDT
jgi:hypothetical protein